MSNTLYYKNAKAKVKFNAEKQMLCAKIKLDNNHSCKVMSDDVQTLIRMFHEVVNEFDDGIYDMDIQSLVRFSQKNYTPKINPLIRQGIENSKRKSIYNSIKDK